MRVIVASKNPVKIAAVKTAFAVVFTDSEIVAEGVSAASGVGDQPMSDDETLRGALNRAKNAKQAEPKADFWVGLEGGLEQRDGTVEAFGWMVVASRDGKEGKSRTATFTLPRQVAELIEKGHELGEADDIVFQRKNSKQENGAVGLLTDDHITRATYYEHALILALIPHKNPELY